MKANMKEMKSVKDSIITVGRQRKETQKKVRLES